MDSQSSDDKGSLARKRQTDTANTSTMMEHLAAAEGLEHTGTDTGTGAPSPSRRTQQRLAHAPNSCDSDLSSNTKAILCSSALVGEAALLESTSTTQSRPYYQYQNAKMKQLNMQAAQSSNQQQQEQAQAQQSNREWMADKVHAGLDWIQKQRERRQREALERQVQEQRRILYEATLTESQRQQLHGGQAGPSSVWPPTVPHPNTAPYTSGGDSGSTNNNSSSTSSHDNNNTMSSHQHADGATSTATSANTPVDDYIPQVRLVDEPPEAPPFILSRAVMQLLLQDALPASIAYSKWTRIYCLARDGDDFGEFLRRVAGQTHTLLVIRTTYNQVFGAYVESPWEPHQHEGFYGSAQACLFKVIASINASKSNDGNSSADANDASDNNKTTKQESVKVFKWTGANRYMQVCDAHNSMIGMGGGGDAFGLCLEQDFSVGSTGHCLTFNNEPLCSNVIVGSGSSTTTTTAASATDGNDNGKVVPQHEHEQQKDSCCFQVVDVEVYGFLLGQF